MDKDEAYWNILSSAMELDFKKGHLKWTISDLSRKSKITRSLIYYYFGRSKIGLLSESVRLIGEEVIGLTPERKAMWERGEFLESLKASRSVIDRAPYIASFYLQHRSRDSEVGESLRKMESSFKRKLKNFYSHLDKTRINTIFSLYWGACFTPDLEEENLVQIIECLRGKL